MKKRNEELEKKNLCEKLLAIKTDIEEELKIQISDLKQEICQLRKSENNMRLKYKRLEQNYGNALLLIVQLCMHRVITSYVFTQRHYN